MEKLYTVLDYKKALERRQHIEDAQKGSYEYEELLLLDEAIKEYEDTRLDWDDELFNEE
ncbi:MAG: hypothetical protein J5I47_04790 [Vicingus serpentipes]|nr:hypothetical protein [Vicingus serpentipes]